MRAGWALVRGGQLKLIGVAAEADFCRLRGGGLRHSTRRRLTRKSSASGGHARPVVRSGCCGSLLTRPRSSRCSSMAIRHCLARRAHRERQASRKVGSGDLLGADRIASNASDHSSEGFLPMAKFRVALPPAVKHATVMAGQAISALSKVRDPTARAYTNPLREGSKICM